MVKNSATNNRARRTTVYPTVHEDSNTAATKQFADAVEFGTRSNGVLYIVATPIGNRDDISLRALDTLRSVDIILAEDTRHSLPLLTTLGIHKPMLSLHAHNEHQKSEQILMLLQQGQSIALISDAGTPLISDPGFPLIRLVQKNQITVVPIPGACALITALCASGVACDSFTFVGFLPAKTQARKNKLIELRQYKHTIICYESTHRIRACLEDIATIYGKDYELVLAKELTKRFEQFIYRSIENIQAWLLADNQHQKGEFVIILPPQTLETVNKKEEDILSLLLEHVPLKQAVKIACVLTNQPKNELYTLGLQLLEKNKK